MDDTIDIASKLQRFMKDQLSNLTSVVTSGGVDNMEDYKYILGQIRTYEYILQEISNLLNKKELRKDAGNIIKLD
jgi:hypothetical protein